MDDCRSFWISWEDNVIRVGRGSQLDVDIIMSYDDQAAETHKIHALSLDSGYLGNPQGNATFWLHRDESNPMMLLMNLTFHKVNEHNRLMLTQYILSLYHSHFMQLHCFLGFYSHFWLHCLLTRVFISLQVGFFPPTFVDIAC